MQTAFIISFLLFLIAARVDWWLKDSASRRVVSWDEFARSYRLQTDGNPSEH